METIPVGAGCLGLLSGLKRYAPNAPAALITVVASILAVVVFDPDGRGVHIVGDIPAGLPPVSIPDLGFADILDLLPGSSGLALVAYAESIALAPSFAAKHNYEVDANPELIGLKASNVGTGLKRGFAMDASLSRSAANDEAGAKTQLAGLINAALMFVTILALTPLFHDLPDAALGAIVISAVVHLIGIDKLTRLSQVKRTEFWIAILAMMGVPTVDVVPGLMVAVGVSLLLLVYRVSRPSTVVPGKVAGQDIYRDTERYPKSETAEFRSELVSFSWLAYTGLCATCFAAPVSRRPSAPTASIPPSAPAWPITSSFTGGLVEARAQPIRREDRRNPSPCPQRDGPGVC